jgi:hypothetical protein
LKNLPRTWQERESLSAKQATLHKLRFDLGGKKVFNRLDKYRQSKTLK